MTRRDVTFPAPFLWGTATSAYQIEGGNENCDWWRFERAPGTPVAEPCGEACDSWNRFEEDLDLVAELGIGAYRFSLEWSRIEPADSAFDMAALARYRSFLEACHTRGIVPVLTLQHFTLPLWLADEGGVESPRYVERCAIYAQRCGEALGDLVAAACTINEPNIVAMLGYLLAMFPPGVADYERFVAVNATQRAAHRAMAEALAAGPGTYPIGLSLNMAEWEAAPGGEELVELARHEMEDLYLEAAREDDFVGVQCYTKYVLGPEGLDLAGPGERTAMGYLYWPQCVESTVRRAAEVSGRPVIVTENGIGTDDDVQRIRYLDEALTGLRRAVDDGVDVRGYFQWSLLDNFEWALGYRPHFGIVAVDRATMARTPKPSASWFAQAAARFS
jgi:beta-glucosidase